MLLPAPCTEMAQPPSGVSNRVNNDDNILTAFTLVEYYLFHRIKVYVIGFGGQLYRKIAQCLHKHH